MHSNERRKTRGLMGNRVLMTQYGDLLSVFIEKEDWTELRIEMAKALQKEDRILMPGFKSAEVINTPDDQPLNETPRVIVSVEGYDGMRYEWEATLQMKDNKEGFKVVGQIHLMSAPEIGFTWQPSLLDSKAS